MRDEDYADAIHVRCRRNGLLVSTEGPTVLLLPSLESTSEPRREGWTAWRARYEAPPRPDLSRAFWGRGASARIAFGMSIESHFAGTAPNRD